MFFTKRTQIAGEGYSWLSLGIRMLMQFTLKGNREALKPM